MEISMNNKKEKANISTKKKGKKKKNLDNRGYLFILPFLIVFLVFSIYPILRTLYLSFTNFDGFTDPQFVGIDN